MSDYLTVAVESNPSPNARGSFFSPLAPPLLFPLFPLPSFTNVRGRGRPLLLFAVIFAESLSSAGTLAAELIAHRISSDLCANENQYGDSALRFDSNAVVKIFILEFDISSAESMNSHLSSFGSIDIVSKV